MSAHDISRHPFDPQGPYTGLRMQQGRVILDSDLNDARALDDEAQRALVVDVVGPHGSPDRGFTIDNVATTGTYDFDILSGTYYLGGYRHTITNLVNPTLPQKFRAQTDWKQSSRDNLNPALPTFPALTVPPTTPRHDLVYLVGWEQGVSAVEDNEIREEAIVGHDTGYRVRRMHRVQVRPGTPSACGDAFATLVADLTAGIHTFDLANYELKSSARLTVIEDPITAAEDLCQPPALQGYNGAEHQAIRVQLFGTKRLLWGLDNASALHRITVKSTDAFGATLVLQTPPRDAAHIPQLGQILEILPWGASLPNGQYVADHAVSAQLGGGVLTRVRIPYDPATRELTVSVENQGVLGDLLAWFDKPPAVTESRYLFARVWNPGDRGAVAEYGIKFEPGEIIKLAGTGLKIKLSQAGIVGDYWVLGARPSTPWPVVPWNLAQEGGASPHGPRRFYSPLAVLSWNYSGTTLQVAVRSCRRTFRPLTRLRGCCTVTVGDERTSFGDFTSINEALRAIPLEESGRICVLPGEYRERVIIEDRKNLVIEGCGARTVLLSPDVNTTSQGLITISRCTNITVRSLHMEATGQFGVMILGAVGTSTVYCRDIVLEKLRITTRRDSVLPAPSFANLKIPTGSAPFPLSTVAAHLTEKLKVLDCELIMWGDLSAAANVTFNDVSYGLIRGCRILTLPTGEGSRAWGGVQLQKGLSITLERNEIAFGLGHGITLGSVSYPSAPSLGYLTAFDTTARIVLADGEDCPNVGGYMPPKAPPPGSDVETTLVFTRAPSALKVLGNHIHDMGGSGISVIGFALDTATDASMVISDDMTVADNVIERNYLRPEHAPPPPEMTEIIAFGGVVLGSANGLRLHDNLIQDNGKDHRYAVCGVYVLHGEDIVVDRNSIRANGPRVADNAQSGNRAGISLQFVGRRVSAPDPESYVVETDHLMPAARVRGNVVHQPAGRALEIYGLGAIFVEGNSLVSEGLTGSEPLINAHCIEIHNIGQSPELVASGAIPANIAYLPAPLLMPVLPLPVGEDLLDGRVLFTDNQVYFKPVAGADVDIRWSVRMQSYGDIAVLGNQFVTTFSAAGHMFTDTSITAWSTRTNDNRWEDPCMEITSGVYQTDLSASTMARMNITAINQASRCIEVTISPNSPVIAFNPIDGLNQTYTPCGVIPGFSSLLVTTPP